MPQSTDIQSSSDSVTLQDLKGRELKVTFSFSPTPTVKARIKEAFIEAIDFAREQMKDLVTVPEPSDSDEIMVPFIFSETVRDRVRAELSGMGIEIRTGHSEFIVGREPVDVRRDTGYSS